MQNICVTFIWKTVIVAAFKTKVCGIMFKIIIILLEKNMVRTKLIGIPKHKLSKNIKIFWRTIQISTNLGKSYEWEKRNWFDVSKKGMD